jgi:hypothetical protein
MLPHGGREENGDFWEQGWLSVLYMRFECVVDEIHAVEGGAQEWVHPELFVVLCLLSAPLSIVTLCVV